MNRVDFSNIKIQNGFWKDKQELIRYVTTSAVYKRFKETGRIDAFKCDPNSEIEPHIFWDSDVAKWIEGVAYLITEAPCPEFEEIADKIIDDIEKNQDENGYFNSYFLVKEPENIFKRRSDHELYCLGHLIEAAIAYYKATGKKKLLDLMCKYIDYVEKCFVLDKTASFVTPGHQEIELALIKLFEFTGKEQYFKLAQFFLEERGQKYEYFLDWDDAPYHQSHLPIRKQKTAEGHAVRATYLYTAMADLARLTNDKELEDSCKSIFDNIINKKMYITGGIGSSSAGEAFTIDYDLPNAIAYTESCAAIGLAFFAQRMLLLENDSKYSNTIERILYNGFLSSISLDGKSFFYCNPLEILPKLHKRDASVKDKSLNLPIMTRKEVFDCSCCPPNITRFIPSIANFLYTYDDNVIYVHQYMESTANIKIGDNVYEIEQKTNYPYDGNIKITLRGGKKTIAVRIPDWCESYQGKTTNGYAYFELNDGDEISLDFEIKPFFIEANPNISSNCGKIAVQKGPFVYCMESTDNGENIRDIRLDTNGSFTEYYNEELKVNTLSIPAYRRKSTSSLYSPLKNDFKKINATLIPYYCFANRGENEMQVWHLAK